MKSNPYAQSVLTQYRNLSSEDYHSPASSQPPLLRGCECLREVGAEPSLLFPVSRGSITREGGITVIRIFLPCHTILKLLSLSFFEEVRL